MFICPKCNNKRTLDNCKCLHDLRNAINIYDFLDSNYKTFFDNLSNYYLDDSLINMEIALRIKDVICNGVVLDIGCGEGSLSLELASLYYEVFALDNSLNALKILSEKVENFKNIKLVRADANNLPFVDESVDIIIANNIFHLLDNPRQVLLEIKRVLKKDGYFIQVSESGKSLFNEEGKKYKIIKDYFNDKYFLLAKKLGYDKVNNKNNFNIHLEINYYFRKVKSVETNPVIYSGTLTIKDFIEREKNRSDYFKANVPIDLHENIISKVLKLTIEEFGANYCYEELNYNGVSVNIIDFYQK